MVCCICPTLRQVIHSLRRESDTGIFTPNVMGISEHLHTTLRHNIRISNIGESSINLILLMQTVILGYLKSFQMAMDDADYNMGLKTRVCCRVLMMIILLYSRLRQMKTPAYLFTLYCIAHASSNKKYW